MLQVNSKMTCLSVKIATGSLAPVSLSDPYWSNVSLLLNGNDSAAGSNTFIDSSTNNFALTKSGSPTQGSVSPFLKNWSTKFNGSTDYVSVTNPSGFLGSGDFTVEFWCKITGQSTNTVDGLMAVLNNIIDNWGSYTGKTYKWRLTCRGVGTTSTVAAAIGVWTHIAVVQSSGTLKLYINGVSDAGSTVSTGGNTTDITTLHIASEVGGSLNRRYNGYLSNVRIVKGNALYTGNFSPPTSKLTAITGTTLLLLQNNNFKDNSTNNSVVGISGTPSVSSMTPFGNSVNGGSGYFNGSTDYLTTPSSTTFDFGTGNFTVDGWFNSAGSLSTSSTALIGTRYGDTAASIQWCVYIEAGGRLGCDIWNTSDARIAMFSHQTVVTPGTWHHYALVRNGSVFTLYLDGVASTTTATSASPVANGSTVVRIGNYINSAIIKFNGLMSNNRIVKGTALYTSSFAPPTSPSSAVVNTSLLTKFENASFLDYTGNSTLTIGSTAAYSTTVPFTSSVGNSLNTAGATGGTGNGTGYITIPSSNICDFGSSDFTIEFWLRLNNVSGTIDHVVFDTRPGSGFYPFIYINSSDHKIYWYINDTIPFGTSQTALSANTWYHIAVTKTGGVARLFRNGTQIGSYTDNNTYSSGPTTFIASQGPSTANTFMNGNLSNFRITKGVARYTGSFSTPSSPFLTQ